MTPVSKEEIYLAKLCGEDWKLPYPVSRLEYYYAKLCGMEVPLPAEPLSRPELYLSCLCGNDVKLPEPVDRKELYMAKACGMPMGELPEPVSGAEYYWYRYVNHISEMIRIPPVNFKGTGTTLLNYQIYGNSVILDTDAVSVGDRTRNLFDMSNVTYGVWISASGHVDTSAIYGCISDDIPATASTYYITVLGNMPYSCALIYYDNNKNFISRNYFTPSDNNSQQITIPSNCAFIRLEIAANTSHNIQPEHLASYRMVLSTDVYSQDYEPYGYKIPVSCRNAHDDSIISTVFINQPLRKVGSYSDVVNYHQQTLTRYVGVMDLGSIHWEKTADDVFTAAAPISNMKIISNHMQGNALCGLYRETDANHVLGENGVFSSCWDGAATPCIHDSSKANLTAEEFKETMNGVYMLYALNQPITENASLPAIAIFKGTNTLHTDTQVAPSKIYMQYRLS